MVHKNATFQGFLNEGGVIFWLSGSTQPKSISYLRWAAWNFIMSLFWWKLFSYSFNHSHNFQTSSQMEVCTLASSWSTSTRSSPSCSTSPPTPTTAPGTMSGTCWQTQILDTWPRGLQSSLHFVLWSVWEHFYPASHSEWSPPSAVILSIDIFGSYTQHSKLVYIQRISA